MFYKDGTFNFHKEIMALAENFCHEWEKRQGVFKKEHEGALVLNFALCTIKYDLEQLLAQMERQPVFGDISPTEVYESGRYGDETPKGLSDQDIFVLVAKTISKIRKN
jgi:hypothetical protein